MLARLLYAAVAIAVLGSFPRARPGRGAEPRVEAFEPSLRAAWAPRGHDGRICQVVDPDGIGRNPSDFAIPRIDR